MTNKIFSVRNKKRKDSMAERATIIFFASHKYGLKRVTFTAKGNCDNIPVSVGEKLPRLYDEDWSSREDAYAIHPLVTAEVATTFSNEYFPSSAPKRCIKKRKDITNIAANIIFTRNREAEFLILWV